MIHLTATEVAALAEAFPWYASLAPRLPTIIASPANPAVGGLHFIDRNKLKAAEVPSMPRDAIVATDARLTGVDFHLIEIAEPWVSFARVSRVIAGLREAAPYHMTADGAWVAETARVAEGVRLAPGSVIGPLAEIGIDCRIGAGVVIHGNVRLGRRCFVQAGAVLGADGFGHGFPSDGLPITISHLGGLNIGDDVDIGPRTVICAGTIDPTHIDDGCKIDGLVYVGHNAMIGRKSIVCAGTVVGGSATVGESVWIHAGAQIKGKGEVGDKAIVGLGAVVVKPVEMGATVMGDTASEMRGRLRREAALDRLIRNARS